MSALDDIRQFLSQLHDNQIDAAIDTATKHGYDRQQTPIPLDSTVAQLQLSRAAISGALDNGFLETMPYAIQNELLGILKDLTNNVITLARGANTYLSVCNSADQLHAWIWRNRIAEKSTKVINLAEKLAELKLSIVETRGLKADLKLLRASLSRAEALEEKVQTALTEVDRAKAGAQLKQQEASQFAQQAENSVTAAADRTKQVDSLLAQTKSSSTEINTYKEDLLALYKEGQTFREQIAKSERTAQATVDENTKETKVLIEELQSLEDQIRVALQKAIGASQFHAFHERMVYISRWKWMWPAIGVAVIGGTLWWIAYLAKAPIDLGPLLYIKLAISIPAGLIVGFCIAQYNKERRLEEEYAFKSTISLSLEPYRDMVDSVLSEEDEASRAKYSDFIISSVNQVFTSPLDHHERHDFPEVEHFSKELLKSVALILRTLLGGRK